MHDRNSDGAYFKTNQKRLCNQKAEYACKIISKKSLLDDRKKKKVEAELQIHKKLKHVHIVEFKHFFEDAENIYILMELCTKYSLQDLISKRCQLAVQNGAKNGYQGLSEVEVRYFMT